ncbi:hypothetical protein QQ045_026999 [Rhodiola kirilowii]
MLLSSSAFSSFPQLRSLSFSSNSGSAMLLKTRLRSFRVGIPAPSSSSSLKLQPFRLELQTTMATSAAQNPNQAAMSNGSNIVIEPYAGHSQIKEIEFMKSSNRAKDCPKDERPEFASLRSAQLCSRKPSLFRRSLSSTNSDLATDILDCKTPKQALRIFSRPKATNIYEPYAAIIHVITGAKWRRVAKCLIKDLIQNIQKSQKSGRACIVAFDVLNSLDSPKFNPDVFGGLIVAFTDMGKVDQAMWVFHRVENLPAKHYCNAFLDGLHKANKFDLMMQVYNHMLARGATPNVITYGTLINACFKHGDPKMGQTFFDQMAASGIKPTSVIYTSIITWLCSENKLSEAERLFRMMQESDVLPNLFTYTSLMDGYCKATEIRKALDLYSEMIQAGLQPNVVTFGVLVDALSKLGDVRAAQSCFACMAKFGVVPNLIVYNCLIDGYCKAGDLPEAMEMWSEMQRFEVLPDVYTYSILIHGLCRVGRVQEAHILFDKMHMSGIRANSVTFNTLIDGFCKQGLMEKALALSSKMTERGIQPNVVTFSALIDGYCKIGNMCAAMGLFSEMIIKGIIPDVVTYSTLIDGHFKMGNMDVALRLHKEMLEAGINHNVFTLCSLIGGLCKDGKIDDAVKLFLEIVGDDNEVSDNLSNHILYTKMIQGLCNSGRMFVASKFFSDMRRRDLRPDAITYVILVRGHFRVKDLHSVAILHADLIKHGCATNDEVHDLLVFCEAWTPLVNIPRLITLKK